MASFGFDSGVGSLEFVFFFLSLRFRVIQWRPYVTLSQMALFRVISRHKRRHEEEEEEEEEKEATEEAEEE